MANYYKKFGNKTVLTISKIIGVYKITNIQNNKVYIGSSSNIYRRWNEHKINLIKNIHQNSELQKDWNDFGESNFEFEIIEQTIKENKLFREQFYIDLFNSFDLKHGYNQTKQIKEDNNKRNLIIKQKLKTERLKNNFTLKQLSEKSGVSKAHISYIEREEKIPTIDIALKLAFALQCHVEDIFYIENTCHKNVI